MNNLTLHPALGWVAGSIIALVMLALGIASLVIYPKQHGNSDLTLGSAIKRAFICWILAILALTPAVASHSSNRAINATDVVIATDITGSMAVHDATYGNNEQTTRLDAAKKAIDDITKQYASASFSAMSFGATASMDVPLTPDARAIDNWANTLQVEPTVNSSGSSLDAGLDQLIVTIKSIHEQHPDDKIVLFFITDGEQTSPKARRSFSSLRHYLTDSCVIGVGSKEGGKIPNSAAFAGSADENTAQWVMDPSTNQPGISKMDEQSIKSIADELSGSTLILGPSQTADNDQMKEMSSKWRVASTEKETTRYIPIVWPFAAALVLLLAWEFGAWLAISRSLL